MNRYNIQAHVNGKPVDIASDNNVHAAANLAEAYHINNGAHKTWVYDRVLNQIAIEFIPANEDMGLPKRARRLMFDNQPARQKMGGAKRHRRAA